MMALLSPHAIGAGLKLVARPLIYFACLWLLWSWHNEKIGLVEKARDNHWQAAIATSNSEVAERSRMQAIEAGKVSARLVDENRTLAEKLAEMEKANAALPNAAARGLDRSRVRLLRDDKTNDPSR